MTIAVDEADEQQWRALLEVSPQSSVFATPDFLAACGESVSFLIVRRRGTVIGGSIVDRSGMATWLQHHSLLLTPEAHEQTGRGSYGTADALTSLIGTVVQQTSDRAQRLSFHPTIVDHRPAAWVFEDHHLSARWQPMSTGIVDLAVGPVRRSTRRQASRKVASLTIGDAGALTDLVEVLKECGIAPLVDDLDWIVSVSRHLISAMQARVFVARSTTHPDTRAATLAIPWRGTLYLMFGASCGTGPDRRAIGPQLDQAMLRWAAAAGMTEVDLLGANGRTRAKYKAGWMSELRSWLEVTWTAPS